MLKHGITANMNGMQSSVVVETSRLVIRELTAADAHFILELLNDPLFLRYIGDKGVQTLADARQYIATGPCASYQQNGFGLFAVTLKDGTAIGMCGILRRPTLSEPDIGFAFLPQYRAQGYAFESASAVTQWAKEKHNLKRLLAIVSPDNEASEKLLGKLQFCVQGLISLSPEQSDVKLFSRNLETET
ncbi:MAG: GNAT family N-acetyltransferase [Pyrinomonadaceae bacterium]